MHHKARTAILSLSLLFIAIQSVVADSFSSKPHRERRVMVVILNRVGWHDIEAVHPPTLESLIERGSVGLLNTRTSRAYSRRGAYETLGAGSRAYSRWRCQDAMAAWETYENGETALQRYTRLTDWSPEGASALVPQIRQLYNDNSNLRYIVQPGALGDELEKWRMRAAAIGSADRDASYSSDSLDRQIAGIAMTSQGKVALGDISKNILHPHQALGVATDSQALFLEFKRCYEQAQLIVVELGDTTRACVLGGWGSPLLRGALLREDAHLAQILKHVDWNRTRVFILSPMSRRRSKNPQSFIVAAGAGLPQGWLTSATTRRKGLVCNIDLAPSILEFLGIPPPFYFYGSQIKAIESQEPGRVRALMKMNREGGSNLRALPQIFLAFIICQSVALLLGLVALIWPQSLPELVRQIAVGFLLFVMALLFALIAVPMLIPMRSLLPWLAGAVGLTALGSALVPRFCSVREESLVTWLTGGMFLLLIFDQLLGARFTLDTPFGNSSVVAGRFYGLGNAGMAVLVGSCLVFVCLLLDKLGVEKGKALLITALIFCLVTLLVGLPFLGANVGGTITCAATFCLAWALFLRQRIGWQGVLGAFFAAGVLLSICLAADVFQPRPSQTHLALNVNLLHHGGFSQFWLIMARKFEFIKRTLLVTRWTPIFLLVFAVMCYAVFKPSEAFRKALTIRSYFSGGLKAALYGGVIGALTNDSGIAIPSLIFCLVAPTTFILALTPPKNPESKTSY